MISDSGLDSQVVQIGRTNNQERDVPKRIEQALVGMKNEEE